MLRRKTALVLITAAMAGLAVLAGCGTLDMQLETDVKASGDYTQRVIITATGAIGESMATEDTPEEMTAEGWEVNRTVSGDTVTLTASKDFSADDPFFLPDATGTDAGSPALDIREQNYFVFTDYSFSANIPADPETLGLEGTGGEFEEGFDELAQSFLQDMFSLSWTVNMPGEILESNADTVSGSSATWNFDLTSVSQGVAMTAEVRVINWAAIAVTAIVGLGLIIAGFMFSRRRH